MTKIRYYSVKAFSYVSMNVFGCMASGSLFVLVAQCFYWLKEGQWKTISVATLLYKEGLPTFEWKGVGKAVHWILEFPIGWQLLLITLIGTLLAFLLNLANEVSAANAEYDKSRLRDGSDV